MSAVVDKPGYWLVASNDGKLSGVEYFATPGTLPGAKITQYVGADANGVRANLNDAIAKARLPYLYEYPGGSTQLIHDVLSKGGASLKQGGGGLTWDLVPTALFAATVGFVAAPFVGAAGAGGAAAGGAGGVGAGEAAGAGAAGGAATKGTGLLSKLGANAGKAAAGLTVASLFAEPGIWKGVGMILAGAILAFLALKQFGGF